MHARLHLSIRSDTAAAGHSSSSCSSSIVSMQQAHFRIMAGTPTMPAKPWVGAPVSCERLLYRSFFMAFTATTDERTDGVRYDV